MKTLPLQSPQFVEYFDNALNKCQMNVLIGF